MWQYNVEGIMKRDSYKLYVQNLEFKGRDTNARFLSETLLQFKNLISHDYFKKSYI